MRATSVSRLWNAKVPGTNPDLVTLVQAENWTRALPTTMVPGSAVRFVVR